MTQDIDARLARVFEGVFGTKVAGEIAEKPTRPHPAWDSIAQINVVMSVEQEFGVTFSPEEAGLTTTLQTLREVIDLRRAKG